VLEYLSVLFTNLVKGVISEVSGEDIHALRSGARFLFGGWSWKENRFRIWELYYEKEVEGFVYTEHSGYEKSRVVVFLGEPSPAVSEKAHLHYRELMQEGDFDRKLDMEPLIVLRDLSREKTLREVDGSLQIAKVYRSGTSEFFGIYWPSENGNPCFHGQEFKESNKPKVRYLDPDTFNIIEDPLPEKIEHIETLSQLEDFDFIKECYPAGNLKEEMSEKERERLIIIFKEHSYQMFVRNPDKVNAIMDSQEEQG
jgi:hypothetical protein